MCSDFIRLKSYDFFRMFEVNPRKKQPFPQNEARLQDKKKTVRIFNNQGHFARFLCALRYSIDKWIVNFIETLLTTE